MDAKELEETVISTIQETQVKLGSLSGTESLYLPLSSVDPDEDVGRIQDVLDSFRESCRPRLGDVSCEILEGRVRITVPESGGRYVSSLPVSPVLRLMVDSVVSHRSLEQLRDALSEQFPSCTWRDVDGDGFEHIAYFDESVDPYVYCIGTECCMVTYHRFSRKDYLAFGFGPLRRPLWTVYIGRPSIIGA